MYNYCLMYRHKPQSIKTLLQRVHFVSRWLINIWANYCHLINDVQFLFSTVESSSYVGMYFGNFHFIIVLCFTRRFISQPLSCLLMKKPFIKRLRLSVTRVLSIILRECKFPIYFMKPVRISARRKAIPTTFRSRLFGIIP